MTSLTFKLVCKAQLKLASIRFIYMTHFHHQTVSWDAKKHIQYSYTILCFLVVWDWAEDLSLTVEDTWQQTINHKYQPSEHVTWWNRKCTPLMIDSDWRWFRDETVARLCYHVSLQINIVWVPRSGSQGESKLSFSEIFLETLHTKYCISRSHNQIVTIVWASTFRLLRIGSLCTDNTHTYTTSSVWNYLFVNDLSNNFQKWGNPLECQPD